MSLIFFFFFFNKKNVLFDRVYLITAPHPLLIKSHCGMILELSPADRFVHPNMHSSKISIPQQQALHIVHDI